MSVRAMTAVFAWQGGTTPQKLVLLALADRGDDDGTAWMAIEKLAFKCSLSERQVQAHLAALEKLGVLKRMPWFNDAGKQTANTYQIIVPGLGGSDINPAEYRKRSGRMAAARGEETITPEGEADITPGGEETITPEGEADITPGVKKSSPPLERIAYPIGETLKGLTKGALRAQGEGGEAALARREEEKKAGGCRREASEPVMPKTFEPVAPKTQEAIDLFCALFGSGFNEARPTSASLAAAMWAPLVYEVVERVRNGEAALAKVIEIAGEIRLRAGEGKVLSIGAVFSKAIREILPEREKRETPAA